MMHIEAQTPVPTGGNTILSPAQGPLRIFFKIPLVAWRMGYARMLPHFVLLTTRGRKSGQPRRTMLDYHYQDGVFYLMAGWGDQSDWVRNIQHDPHVTIQTVGEGVFGGYAERVTENADIERVFFGMQNTPALRPYLARLGIENRLEDVIVKKNRLHIIRITTEGKPPMLPQETDLLWVNYLVGASLVIGWLLGRMGRSR